MKLVFMPLVAAMIVERISVKAGLWLLPELTAIGAASVWRWYVSESHGQGDLRMYAAVQVYGLVIFLVAVVAAALHAQHRLALGRGLNGLAKLLETWDRRCSHQPGAA